MLLAQRLKDLRSEKGLSQSALADILGRTQQAIGKWEVGKSEPDGATLLKLANYFNVSVDYLLGRTDEPQAPHTAPTAEPQKEDEGGTILMRAQNELDPDELQQLENMAEYFLDKKLKGK